jgi:hypothetical protein
LAGLELDICLCLCDRNGSDQAIEEGESSGDDGELHFERFEDEDPKLGSFLVWLREK